MVLRQSNGCRNVVLINVIHHLPIPELYNSAQLY